MTDRILTAGQLARRCDPATLGFATTAELADLDEVVGQARATEAVRFAIAMPDDGYHVYLMGPPGSGKRAIAQQAIRAQPAAPRQPRGDWVYVNHFARPHQPLALRLPPGRGTELRDDMRRLVQDLQTMIPAVFESEEYTAQVERIGADIGERASRALQEVADSAERQGIAMIRTPGGFTFAPQKDGEVIAPGDFEKLPPDEQQRIRATIEQVQEQLVRVLRNTVKLRKEHSDRVRELNRAMTRLAVDHAVEELKARYAALPRVTAYLDAVRADVIDNAEDFRRPEEGVPREGPREAAELHRYQVNVLVDAGPSAEAPVVVADHPSFQNLIGRVDHIARFGTLMTDFTLIKPGDLHRANGGYLLVDAAKLLAEPFAWPALKRALKRREIRIESLADMVSLVSTVQLEPEPIPLDVKVVLFGERLLYYLLQRYDPEFDELFRIAADVDDELPRDEAMQRQLARVIATHARARGLRPLQAPAVARLLDHGARLAGDGARVSARVQRLLDLAAEADQLARAQGHPEVGAADVAAAIDAQRRRASRIDERIREDMLRGTLLIDTGGGRVGQVNALAVHELGGHRFGAPARVTATVRFGEGQVIDVQRETELGGPIHAKGVLILAAFLAARFSRFAPHAIAASLVFEQTYTPVEGDSASLAELLALMSALAQVPLAQRYAVTGSVNQLGEVQAIGGVNEKIEGFFDLCAARGLDGAQGVLIPAANVQHLMLRDDVVAAVRDGRFAVHAVQTVDDALALVTGVPAGRSEPPWDDASVNGRIARRLRELAAVRRGEPRFGRRPPAARPPRGAGKAT